MEFYTQEIKEMLNNIQFQNNVDTVLLSIATRTFVFILDGIFDSPVISHLSWPDMVRNSGS